MSCTRCTKPFALFTKEYGCTNCRYSFCSKCLSQKAVVPRTGKPKPQPVCPGCYQQLTATAAAQVTVKPTVYNTAPGACAPDVLPPPSMRGTVAAQTNKQQKVRSGETEQDRLLAERLQRIKQQRSDQAPVPSQAQIEGRLAELRDCDPALVGKPREMFYSAPDKRSQTERSRDLVNQMHQEVNLDAALPNPDEDLANRLARLRGQPETPVAPQPTPTEPMPEAASDISSSKDDSDMSKLAAEIDELIAKAKSETQAEAKAALEALAKDKEIQAQLEKIREQTQAERSKDENISKELGAQWEQESSDSDSESESKRMSKMVCEQAELEERLGRLSGDSVPDAKSSFVPKKSPEKTEESEDEFPWCCICNADATLRCAGCDGDLYCNSCYKQGHDREDYKEHTTQPFKAKKIETQV